MKLGFDLELLIQDAVTVAFAFALAFPIGWERGRGRHSVGFRTLPIVAIAACGFGLVVETSSPSNAEAQARVLQGVVTGIGFIGGGAIVKQRGNVKGLVTAASIWNAGAIGVAVGLNRLNIAIVLSAVNVLTLWALAFFNIRSDEDESDK
ncbi:MgtC/SapB family protein [Sinorhizobium fredii]|uniref:MgtC/SapB family protein n=1 Tax=Rhizobium fredii TaxID=380 RepID=UPI00055DDA48|nr:MgtC/SapB family protein [Sinorhizobium fredii]